MFIHLIGEILSHDCHESPSYWNEDPIFRANGKLHLVPSRSIYSHDLIAHRTKFIPGNEWKSIKILRRFEKAAIEKKKSWRSFDGESESVFQNIFHFPDFVKRLKKQKIHPRCLVLTRMHFNPPRFAPHAAAQLF